MSLQPGPYDPLSGSLNPTPQPDEPAQASPHAESAVSDVSPGGYVLPGSPDAGQSAQGPSQTQPGPAETIAPGYRLESLPAASATPASATPASAPSETAPTVAYQVPSYAPPPASGPILPPPPAWPPASGVPGSYPPAAAPEPGPVPGAVPPSGAVPPLGSQMGYPMAPGYPGQVPVRQTESKAIVGLILAIGSWVVCPVVLAIVALILANQSNREIAASGGRLDGQGLNTATKVISWLNIGFTVLAVVAAIVFTVLTVLGLVAVSIPFTTTTLTPTPFETGF